MDDYLDGIIGDDIIEPDEVGTVVRYIGVDKAVVDISRESPHWSDLPPPVAIPKERELGDELADHSDDQEQTDEIMSILTASNREARIDGRNEVLDIIPDRRPYKAIKEYAVEQLKRGDELGELKRLGEADG